MEEIQKFEKAMLNELKANERKGHWSDNDATPADQVKEVIYHAQKLLIAVLAGNADATLEYAADVANHAMFTADLAGALDAKLDSSPAEGEDYNEGVPWAKKLPPVKAETYDDFYNRFLVRAKKASEA